MFTIHHRHVEWALPDSRRRPACTGITAPTSTGAGLQDRGSAYCHYVSYGHYEGSWCPSEQYYNERPDVRADGYCVQGKWYAFDHFNEHGSQAKACGGTAGSAPAIEPEVVFILIR